MLNQRSMWSSDLSCGWTAWRVVDDGHLALETPSGQYCSMAGAIKAAEALCPLVWRIDTYVGGEVDTMYVLRPGREEWSAMAGLKA